MITKHTLESVQADFQQWRQNKLSPKEQTPEDLKQKSVALLNDMPTGKITKALGLSSKMLKSWANLNAKTPVAKKPIEFVALTENSLSAPAKIPGLKLDVTEPTGKQWCLQGDVNALQLETFIRLLGGQS